MKLAESRDAAMWAPRVGVTEVEALLDLALLAEAGWDAEHMRFRFRSVHRVVGQQRCRVENCAHEISYSNRLCTTCHDRWVADGTDLEEFVEIPRKDPAVHAGDVLCLVCRTARHERPGSCRGLCCLCYRLMSWRGQSVQGFVNGDDRFPPAVPRLSYGLCAVDACGRLAAYPNPVLCQRHKNQWAASKPADLERFCRTAGPVHGDLNDGVWFGALSKLVVHQVLFGIQWCIARGRQVRRREIRAVCDDRRADGAVDLADATQHSEFGRSFVAFTLNELEIATGNPESERQGDVWNLRIWGYRENVRLDFRRIELPWLRDAAKQWLAQAITNEQGMTTLHDKLAGITRLAEHLQRVCPSATPAALDQAAKERYLAELRLDEASGVITSGFRNETVRRLRQFVHDVSGMGLCDPGGPLAGVAGGFQVSPEEIPPRWSSRDPEDEVGRALPEVIIAQLLSAGNLASLAPMWQRLMRIMIDTGRRPDELCQLPLDCLGEDLFIADDGTQLRLPVLIHNQPKVKRSGVRLPITAETAATIREQQAAVRARFPDSSEARLVLFPRRGRNPFGDKATMAGTFSAAISEWRGKGLDLFEAVIRDHRVEPLLDAAGMPIRFPVVAVFPYAFRHSYAQRHIDAGVPVTVLAELMGHLNINTTQAYYRVRTQQKREALDRVTRFQVTARGSVISASGDSAATAGQRVELGSVGAPMGSCAEPSNVKAHGRACPFRHRCFGCAHYRTDVSHLPDLRAYLNQLLVAREELADTNPDLAEWARRQAMPSDDEIATVRRLIDGCESLLDELAAKERQELLRHIETLRESRQHLVDAVPVAFLNTVVQSAPTLFPALETSFS